MANVADPSLPSQTVESYSWKQAWWLALTKPRTVTYERLTKDPKATLKRGMIWILGSSAIAQIIFIIISRLVVMIAHILPEFDDAFFRIANLRFGVLSTRMILCGVLLPAFLILMGILVYVGAVQFIAGAIGGRGTFTKLFYAISAQFAPIIILGAFISVLPIGRYLIVPFFLVRNLLAINAVHQFGWGRAIASMLILFLIVALILIIVGLGVIKPIIEDLYKIGV